VNFESSTTSMGIVTGNADLSLSHGDS
jgi:hypothetical protein